MGSSVATPVEATLSAAGSTAWFSPSPTRPFNAWVLAGAWSGSLYLEKSPDAGVTAIPIVAEGIQLYMATGVGVSSVEEPESGVLWRWTAAAGFSGTATVRLSQ